MNHYVVLVLTLGALVLTAACGGGTVTHMEYARAVCAVGDYLAPVEGEDERTDGQVRTRARILWDDVPTPPNIFRDYHEAVRARLDTLLDYLDRQPEYDRYDPFGDADIETRARIYGLAWFVRAEGVALPYSLRQMLSSEGCYIWDGE